MNRVRRESAAPELTPNPSYMASSPKSKTDSILKAKRLRVSRKRYRQRQDVVRPIFPMVGELSR